MKKSKSFIIATFLLFVFSTHILPCGPYILTPVFDIESQPEVPYENFAAGKIGILKPKFHRSVLFAAYRYINGGTFTAAEQKALIDVWNAEYNNRDYVKDDSEDVIKAWAEQRKKVFGKDEKAADIYTERDYGGYDFFPNCTPNAFETATATLGDRIASYGSDNQDVKNWVIGQDAVFANCSSGKIQPADVDGSQPVWLQKDRAYQKAAASFYSLDYEEAKSQFSAIAQDFESPWRETADYLVGRTILRQASLTKNEARSTEFYTEAEGIFYRIAAGGGKFSGSAENLLGLIKFRLHPQERTVELAQNLAYQNSGENFRQQLIDFTWLLDKFQKESLEKEEKRKADLKPKETNANTDIDERLSETKGNADEKFPPTDGAEYLTINIYDDEYKNNWTIYVKPEATDEETLAEAARVVTIPLTESLKKRILDSKKFAYTNLYSSTMSSPYPGAYYGEEELSRSILPAFMRENDLVDWLFSFQIQTDDAYRYALGKYRQTNSDLWLMTAISKADKDSTDINRLLEAAGKISPTAIAYPTVAYHQARILLDQNKKSEAKKILDGILLSTNDLPLSSINQFAALRFGLADDLEDFLRYAHRVPFGLTYGSEVQTLDQIIAEQKEGYNPEYSEGSKEEYDANVDKEYADEISLKGKPLLDDKATALINQHFPLTLLIETEKSPALPEYERKRFVTAIFVRALLLENYPFVQQFAPRMIEYFPDSTEEIKQILTARTPIEKQRAGIYLILKNEELSPYVPSGFGTSQEQFSYATFWWCTPYEDEDYKPEVPDKPAFVTAAQSKAAQTELAKIKKIGDAPKYLGEAVLNWAKAAPRDRRLPESLSIVYDANGWDKYGCGSNDELHTEIGAFLKKNYPSSEGAQKVLEEEKAREGDQ